MLTNLSIKNFAIIDQIELDFSSGMTVLSGETGAGKSIIIDALGILCGGRGSTDYIRQGTERLAIEGQFIIQPEHHTLLTVLHEYGIELDSEDLSLIIRREISQSGNNTIRLNGQLANVSTLKKIGTYLVDIHGQYEHQTLLDQNRHGDLLDVYGQHELQQCLDDYNHAYSTYRSHYQQWVEVYNQTAQQDQRIEFLQFQLEEIERYHLVPGEYEELEQMSQQLQNSQRFYEVHQLLIHYLSEGEHNMIDLMNKVEVSLQEITEVYPKDRELLSLAFGITYDLEELIHRINQLQFDQADNQSIDDIENRLGELSALKRKYKMDIPDLINYYQQISEEVYQLTHRERFLEELAQKVQDAYYQALQLAEEIHRIRQQIAERLEQAIHHELADLHMKSTRFKVRLQGVERIQPPSQLFDQSIYRLNSRGMDQISFDVSTNIGEDFKPLIAIASGGELSRLMLALKSVLAKTQPAMTMIFDEIDTGVSGEVTYAIAQKMYQIAQAHQVVCITHHPQVAAIADHQVFIRKVIQQERTSTVVQTLTMEERIDHIASMISGENITKASLTMAKELMKQLSEYKGELHS